MPVYDYFCEENGKTVAVKHDMETVLSTWGEVCYAAQVSLGETEFLAAVRKVLSVPNISIPVANSTLKNLGFTKLVKRGDGVYENVTRTGDEPRYMQAGDKSSLPHFSKKITD